MNERQFWEDRWVAARRVRCSCWWSAWPCFPHLRLPRESHLAQGNQERALPDLNEAIRLDPKSVTAFVYRGVILGARGEHDRAISDFTAAIQIEPFSAELRARRADAYRSTKDYERALADA